MYAIRSYYAAWPKPGLSRSGLTRPLGQEMHQQWYRRITSYNVCYTKLLRGALRARNLLGVAFGAGLLAVIVAVVGIALRRRPGSGELWVGVGVAAVYGMVLVRMAIEERTHLFEYGLVAVLIHAALDERRRGGRRVPAPPVLAVVATALLGWLDEAIQTRNNFV